MSIIEEKKALRREMRAVRKSIEEAQSKAVLAAERFFAIPQVAQAESFFCYISVDTEMSTKPVIERLLKDGKRIYVPYTEKSMMSAVRYDEDMVEGDYGIPTPRRLVFAQETPQVVIVPALACDRRGARLGYGGGYYDRYLGEHKCFVCAYIFAEQLKDSDLPSEEHDMRMPCIVTPNETLYI